MHADLRENLKMKGNYSNYHHHDPRSFGNLLQLSNYSGCLALWTLDDYSLSALMRPKAWGLECRISIVVHACMIHWGRAESTYVQGRTSCNRRISATSYWSSIYLYIFPSLLPNFYPTFHSKCHFPYNRNVVYIFAVNMCKYFPSISWGNGP